MVITWTLILRKLFSRLLQSSYWFASASLANPYCQSMWMSVCMYWFASASLANPYCQSM